MEKREIGRIALPFEYVEQFTNILLDCGYIVEVLKRKALVKDDTLEKDSAFIIIYQEII